MKSKLLFFLPIMFLVCGCISINIKTTVNPNGSIIKNIKLIVPKEMSTQLHNNKDIESAKNSKNCIFKESYKDSQYVIESTCKYDGDNEITDGTFKTKLDRKSYFFLTYYKLKQTILKQEKEKPKPKICTICNGTGKEKCLYCNGTGQDYDYFTNTYKPCSHCNGTGYITCSFCKGTGYDTSSQQFEEEINKMVKDNFSFNLSTTMPGKIIKTNEGRLSNNKKSVNLSLDYNTFEKGKVIIITSKAIHFSRIFIIIFLLLVFFAYRLNFIDTIKSNFQN